MNLDNIPLRTFYREDQEFYFLIRKPYKTTKNYEKKNKVEYKLFNVYEIYNSGLFIGYYIEVFKEVKYIYSNNFILFGFNNIISINHLLKTNDLNIFENENSTSILIIGNNNEPNRR